MRLLILGGTLFLGRHLADQALARGHRVTLFHRGRTAPGLFPGADHRLGDRFGGLETLAEGRWDAVVDTSAWHPRAVDRSTALLRGRVGTYLFVSSLSAVDASRPGIHEETPVLPWSGPWPAPSEDRAHYGEMKALCEGLVRDRFPGAMVVRPGLLVGPHDPSDRFTWWPCRAARGGEILCPDEPGRPVQVLDARDLSSWLLDCAEDGETGTWNAVGPPGGLTMGGVLEACLRHAPPGTFLTWVPEDRLLEHGVAPWIELPLWVPRDNHLLEADGSRAWLRGLATRPLEVTVESTLAWRRDEAGGRPWRAGLAPDRERSLLARLVSGRPPLPTPGPERSSP